MADLQRDPVINVIENGIKGDIDFTLHNERFRATVLLIYSGMDSMAYLGMPPGQEDVTKADFVSWADRYIRFPCKEQICGDDFYGARCGMLHTYGPTSRMSKFGKCRLIGYSDHSVPEVRFNPNVSNDLVMVSIRALKDAFFRGIDRSLVDVFSSKERAAAAEARLTWLTHILPFKENAQDGTKG